MSRVSDIDENDPLLRRTRKLTTDITPPDDLWPGIQARLKERASVPWASPRIAIAAVLLVSISSTLTVWLGGEFRNVQTQEQTIQSTSGYADVSLTDPHQVMGPQFVQARTDVVLSLEKELDKLSPKSRQVLADNLNNIDEAIHQINTALKDSPESDLLLHLLLSTYTDQLTLLGTIDGMTRSANERSTNENERTQL